MNTSGYNWLRLDLIEKEEVEKKISQLRLHMVIDTGQFFRALKITRAYLMMLEDIVAEDLSRMQNRKPAVPHKFMRATFHKRKKIREYRE